MFSTFSSFTRAGALALGLITAATAGAGAAPITPLANAAPVQSAPATANLLPVAEQGHRVRPWVRNGGRHWRGDRGWRGNREWRGNRHWRGNRGWRGDRRYYGRRYDGAAAILGFGLGLGTYGLADRYYAPRYVPRRVYRGDTHVQWCYARYRSYRASDNTFQPNHGPRRQCNSPYG